MSIPKQIQELFFSKLESQTNWRRTQLKTLYLECVADVYYYNDLASTGKIPILPSKPKKK